LTLSKDGSKVSLLFLLGKPPKSLTINNTITF